MEKEKNHDYYPCTPCDKLRCNIPSNLTASFCPTQIAIGAFAHLKTRNCLGRVQTNSSQAGQSTASAELYFSIIPISVARQVAWTQSQLSCSGTNTNNTNIKHRASSAQLSPALLQLIWSWRIINPFHLL